MTSLSEMFHSCSLADVQDSPLADLWQQTASLTDIPVAPTCSACHIDMKIGNGFMSCPQCLQYVDYDMGATAPLAERTIVVRNDGNVRSYEKVDYDKRKILIAHYEAYLKRTNLVFDSTIIERATDMLLAVQEVSTSNRGRNLTEMMAGCLYAATLERHSIAETTIARMFNTRGGLSRGKNAVIGLLVKRQMIRGEGINSYFRKASKPLYSRAIRENMLAIGLDPDNRNLYMFIKSLCFIEECYNYIDTQIFTAKIVGAICFYFMNCCPGRVVPTPMDVLKKLGISPETMKKIYRKLEMANHGYVIERVGKILGVAVQQKITSI